MNLGVAIDAFLTHLSVERGLSAATVEAYGRDLAALAARVGDVEVGALDAAALRGHVDALERRGLAAATRARSLSAVARLLAWLRAEGELASDPLADLARPKRGRKVPKVLSAQEALALVRAPDETDLGLRDRALLEVMYAAGLRVSELTSLRLADLQLASRSFTVQGKGRRERLALLGEPAVHAHRALPGRGAAALGAARRRARAVRERAREAAHPPGRLVPDPQLRPGARHRAQADPARAAPLVRDAPARGRRRPADRAGDAGPRRHRHHRDLHTRESYAGCTSWWSAGTRAATRAGLAAREVLG